MSVAVEQIVIDDVWPGLYGESWKGLICDEAFAHPAKFSRALIRRIYDHVVEEGWATKGASVVDPFGGVALGAFDAMRHGLNWYGCELEEKFVGLGGQNITLWSERFSRMPNWGTARLLQGDSRKLASAIAECCVSSPPYAGNEKSDYQMSDDGKTRRRDEKRGFRQGHGCFRGSEGAYGQSEGQLGAMREGDLNLVVSSPPYAGSLANAKNYADPEKAKADSEREFMKHRSATYSDLRYGDTEGNLGAMPEGQLCVTSPPYEGCLSTEENKDREGGTSVTTKYQRSYGREKEREVTQPRGQQDGRFKAKPHANLGNMRGGFDAAISSPPYEGIQVGTGDGDRKGWRGYTDIGGGTYANEAQLSAQAPETFWSASRLILEQLHQVIIPGGHAVFVVKAFVRDRKIVDFPGQWAMLCEAVGFRLLHHHRASLVEHSGTQGGFEQDKEITVERKSFFRRLAEKKGSPRIDHESVLCFERLE